MERVESKLPCTWRRPFLCLSDHSHNNRSLFHFSWFTPKSLNSRSWKCSHFWFHIRSQEERWRLAGGLCTTVLYFEPNTSTVWAAPHTAPILSPKKSDFASKQIRCHWQTDLFCLDKRKYQEDYHTSYPAKQFVNVKAKRRMMIYQNALGYLCTLMKESLKKTKTTSRHSWELCLC